MKAFGISNDLVNLLSQKLEGNYISVEDFHVVQGKKLCPPSSQSIPVWASIIYVGIWLSSPVSFFQCKYLHNVLNCFTVYWFLLYFPWLLLDKYLDLLHNIPKKGNSMCAKLASSVELGINNWEVKIWFKVCYAEASYLLYILQNLLCSSLILCGSWFILTPEIEALEWSLKVKVLPARVTQ